MQLTVGKLRELTKDLPDSTVVVSRDDNYELRGAITELSDSRARVRKFRKKTEWFRDDFDGTNYSCEVYVHDEENGTEMLYI